MWAHFFEIYPTTWFDWFLHMTYSWMGFDCCLYFRWGLDWLKNQAMGSRFPIWLISVGCKSSYYNKVIDSTQWVSIFSANISINYMPLLTALFFIFMLPFTLNNNPELMALSAKNECIREIVTVFVTGDTCETLT